MRQAGASPEQMVFRQIVLHGRVIGTDQAVVPEVALPDYGWDEDDYWLGWGITNRREEIFFGRAEPIYHWTMKRIFQRSQETTEAVWRWAADRSVRFVGFTYFHPLCGLRTFQMSSPAELREGDMFTYTVKNTYDRPLTDSEQEVLYRSGAVARPAGQPSST